MANTVIRVTPAELRSVASKVRAQAEDYSKQYNQLMTDVDSMAAAWKGKDNTAFTNRIKGFMTDFQKMRSVLDEYAAFLDQAAQTYQNTQDKIAEAAQRL